MKFFLHGNCCKQPVSIISPSVKSKVVELKLYNKYLEANIKHFTELFTEYENISLSYSTVSIHKVLKLIVKNVYTKRKLQYLLIKK